MQIQIRKKRSSPQPYGENRFWGLLLILPWLLGLLFFKLIPILSSLTFSFTDFYLLEPGKTQFVGLENYIAIFNDPDSWKVLGQTLSLALIIIPIQVGAAISMATLLSNPKLRMANTLRTLFFIPSILPALSAALMWQGFLNPSSGWLNQLLLNPLGLGSLNHLNARSAGLPLFIITSLWSIGPGFLIMLGSMQSIPPEIHEAARIDGAGRLRQFFSITLPLISPATFFTIILNLTGLLGGVVLLDHGNTYNNSLSSYDAYINFLLFSMFRLGRASSAAWIFFVFVMMIVLTLFVTSKYWVYFPDREN